MNLKFIIVSKKTRIVLTCNHDLCDKPLHIPYNNRVTPASHKFDTQKYPRIKRVHILFKRRVCIFHHNNSFYYILNKSITMIAEQN